MIILLYNLLLKMMLIYLLMHKKNKKSKKELIKQNDMNNSLDKLNELCNDTTVNSECIKLYSDIIDKFPTINIEDPVYIRQNMEIMALKLELYKKFIEITILSNTDSLTDNTVKLLNSNDYIKYLEKIIDIYK